MAGVMLMLACCCSSLSASAAGGYFGALIPNTEPHFLKVSGATQLLSKENMDFFDENLSDPTRRSPGFKLYETEKDKVDTFCSDFKVLMEYEGPDKVFTLGGMKGKEKIMSEKIPELLYQSVGEVRQYCKANAQSYRVLQSSMGEGTATAA
jgi:hypothetical protein|tara:strand:- start:36 stop:488 length:453 start_codon:yes stop_codon:yes gene_type:complete